MKKLINLLRWVDNNILKLLLLGFIFAIPLYPKIPFIDLEYTYISIRIEDFYIAIFILVFIIQLLRHKVTLNKDFMWFFIAFWAAVFLSFLYNHYFQRSVPVFNIGLLHAARRVEYMIIFFITLSIVNSKKDLIFYLKAILLALLIVSFYGIGQKFFGFPAIQTMNPEFALGRILYLTPEARVSSTFAGHYDLAAYLVFLLPIIMALYLWRRKTVYFIIYLIGLFTLVLTASRISSIAYLGSIVPFLLFMRKWKILIIVLVVSIGLSLTSTNLIARFMRTVQIKQIFINTKTGQVVVPQKMTAQDLPAGSFYVKINQKNNKVPIVSTSNEALLKQTLIDGFRDNARKEGVTLTATEEASMAANISANLTPVNTVVSDISFATRLQVEWPRAFNAFLKNPLLGTGPSSITEATDNDYLRWIGEFGALGTLLFLLILFLITKKVIYAIFKLQTKDRIIYYGFLFGCLGLLLNASYIDVFEASKVAYYFWMLTGIILASLKFIKPESKA